MALPGLVGLPDLLYGLRLADGDQPYRVLDAILQSRLLDSREDRRHLAANH
jgi:hypothetical protein